MTSLPITIKGYLFDFSHINLSLEHALDLVSAQV